MKTNYLERKERRKQTLILDWYYRLIFLFIYPFFGEREREVEYGPLQVVKQKKIFFFFYVLRMCDEIDGRGWLVFSSLLFAVCSLCWAILEGWGNVGFFQQLLNFQDCQGYIYFCFYFFTFYFSLKGWCKLRLSSLILMVILIFLLMCWWVDRKKGWGARAFKRKKTI